MKFVFYFVLVVVFAGLSCQNPTKIKCIKMAVIGSQDRPTPVLIIADDSVYHLNDPWIWNFEYFVTSKTLKEIETLAHGIKEDTTSENTKLYRAFEIEFIDDLNQSPNEKKKISLNDTRIFLDSICGILKRINIDSIGIEKIEYLKSRVDW
jgi:hypothetical protein